MPRRVSEFAEVFVESLVADMAAAWSSGVQGAISAWIARVHGDAENMRRVGNVPLHGLLTYLEENLGPQVAFECRQVPSLSDFFAEPIVTLRIFERQRRRIFARGWEAARSSCHSYTLNELADAQRRARRSRQRARSSGNDIQADLDHERTTHLAVLVRRLTADLPVAYTALAEVPRRTLEAAIDFREGQRQAR